MSEAEEICNKCRKPILPDEPRNGLSGSHWDCDPRENPRDLFKDMERALGKAQRSLNRLKRKL